MLLQKSLFVIPEVFIGNPVFFKTKDFWIPAYRRQARLRGYDDNSHSLNTFARGSVVNNKRDYGGNAMFFILFRYRKFNNKACPSIFNRINFNCSPMVFNNAVADA